MRYAALDLECATSDTGNICEVGAVVMEDGKEVGRFRSLVRPVVESFGDWQRWNFDYSLKDTLKAPAFPEVWARVADMIGDSPVVAHNAGVVECKHLGHVFSFYDMDPGLSPNFYCTFELARTQWTNFPKHGIKHVARHFGWKLDHHNPESDARVCAAIVERVCEEQGIQDWDALVETNHWNAHRVPQFKSKIQIASKPTGVRSRSDYQHELVTWEPTQPLSKVNKGMRFILSGFDASTKHKLRELGQKNGLQYKRFLKGGVDFLVADEKMGAAKYATCVDRKIPILSAGEFKSFLKELQK